MLTAQRVARAPHARSRIELEALTAVLVGFEIHWQFTTKPRLDSRNLGPRH